MAKSLKNGQIPLKTLSVSQNTYFYSVGSVKKRKGQAEHHHSTKLLPIADSPHQMRSRAAGCWLAPSVSTPRPAAPRHPGVAELGGRWQGKHPVLLPNIMPCIAAAGDLDVSLVTRPTSSAIKWDSNNAQY